MFTPWTQIRNMPAGRGLQVKNQPLKSKADTSTYCKLHPNTFSDTDTPGTLSRRQSYNSVPLFYRSPEGFSSCDIEEFLGLDLMRPLILIFSFPYMRPNYLQDDASNHVHVSLAI